MTLGTLTQSKGLRHLGVAICSLLVLWAAAWLIRPPLLKHQLESRVSEQLGRSVTVGRVDFSPWSLELTVDDVAVAHASAADPTAQLAIKRLYIDMEMQSLLRLAPVVDALQVESPQLRLKHLGGGHYDVDDVLARFSQTPVAPDAKPLGFALYNLALTQGAAATGVCAQWQSL